MEYIICHTVYSDLVQLDTPEKTTSTKQRNEKQSCMSSQLQSKKTVPSALHHQRVTDMKTASPLTRTSNHLIGSLKLQEQPPVAKVIRPLQGVDQLLFGSPSVAPNDMTTTQSEKQKVVESDSGLVDVRLGYLLNEGK